MLDQRPHVIFADWGTTNLRAFALDRDWKILDKRESRHGIRNIDDGRYAKAFHDLIGDWRTGKTPLPPVFLSGMIGSRQGWVEASYAVCPVSPDDLACQLTAVPGVESAWIVPGICLKPDGPRRDVIRGEEVQIFGALEALSRHDAILCLPGTHSKWARVQGGVIVDFATAMTGEVFQAMKEHTILSALMTSDETHHPQSFVQGLEQSATYGGLLQHLFSVRADGLFDFLPAEGLQSYLSGILIGHEIRDLSHGAEGANVILVGASALATRYGEAFAHFGQPYSLVEGDAAAIQGLRAIAQRSNLLS